MANLPEEKGDFENYPLNTAKGQVGALNLQLYKKTLELRSTTLFVTSPQNCGVELWQPPVESGKAEPEPIELVRISTLRDLQTVWKSSLLSEKTTVLIITRQNSWSRMKILPDMFKYVCAMLEIQPEFLDIIFGFGYRTSSSDQTFVSFHKSLPVRGAPIEICYCLRFFEPNGQQNGDAWSCRQSAIHQKHYDGRGTSAWTIIQPPVLFRENAHDCIFKRKGHPLALHVRFIKSCIVHWRSYLNAKDSELLSLKGKIMSSLALNLFETNLSTLQEIISIRGSLHLALTVIVGTIKILAKLSTHCVAVGESKGVNSELCCALAAEFDLLSTEMEMHKSATKRLVNISSDLFLTNQNILHLRNQELLVNNGAILTQLGQTTASESKALSTMTKYTVKDSRTTRIATVMATVYLPATLVMSFFSTGFVNFHPRVESNGTTVGVRIEVYSQVWIAVVMSSFLAVATMVLLYIWVQRFARIEN